MNIGLNVSRVFKKSFLYLLGNITRRGMGFLMIPLYTHFLRPADYGIIELVELFVMIAGVTFGMAAVSDSMVRIHHEYQQPAQRDGVVSTALATMGIVSVTVTVLAALIARQLSMLVFGTAEFAWFIRMAFVAMVFSNMIEVALVYQRLQQRAAFFVTFSVLQLGANLSLNVYLIAFAGMGIWGFLLGKLFSTGIGAVLLLGLVLREVGWRLQWESVRRLSRFGGPLVLTSSAFFVIHFSDRFFLSHYAGLGAVGIYALAYKFAFLVTFLVGEPFENAWGVTFYAHTSQSEWKQQFARVASYLIFFLFLLAIVLTVFGGEILVLVADKAYLAAALVVPVLVFGYVFREVGDFFRGMLFINKRVGRFSAIAVASALLNLCLNFWLISRFQIAGAAWATLLTWLTYMVGCWLMAYREHQLPYPLASFVQLCVLSLSVYLARLLLFNMTLGWQWVMDSALVVAFVLTAWLTGYFPRQERVLVQRYVALRRDNLMSLIAQLR